MPEIRARWLHALCIGSNPCRPYESYVYVGCDRSRMRSSGVRREYDGSAKGGQFGLSLGLLLSKGGMMKPVAGSSALCEQRSRAARTSDSEE